MHRSTHASQVRRGARITRSTNNPTIIKSSHGMWFSNTTDLPGMKSSFHLMEEKSKCDFLRIDGEPLIKRDPERHHLSPDDVNPSVQNFLQCLVRPGQKAYRYRTPNNLATPRKAPTGRSTSTSGNRRWGRSIDKEL